MASLYEEIFYAAYLLKGDTPLSPKVRQKISSFMAQCKRSLQTATIEHGARDRKDKGLCRDKHGRLEKGGVFYIKSFYYSIENDTLVLYTRIYGQDTRLDIRRDRRGVYNITLDRGGVCSPKIEKFLTGILDYWIPSENSLEKYGVNLMPYWRHTPQMG